LGIFPTCRPISSKRTDQLETALGVGEALGESSKRTP
jgi:hypothetical protein